MEFIISPIAGAAGGNLTGMLANSLNQGTLINSVAGMVGGGPGGQILSLLGAGGVAAKAATGGRDLATIVSQVAGGSVGCGVLLALVAMVRNTMAK